MEMGEGKHGLYCRTSSDAHRVHANHVTKAKAEKGKTSLTLATAAVAPSPVSRRARALAAPALTLAS